jgi:hypothetical protein
VVGKEGYGSEELVGSGRWITWFDETDGRSRDGEGVSGLSLEVKYNEVQRVLFQEESLVVKNSLFISFLSSSY